MTMSKNIRSNSSINYTRKPDGLVDYDELLHRIRARLRPDTVNHIALTDNTILLSTGTQFYD